MTLPKSSLQGKPTKSLLPLLATTLITLGPISSVSAQDLTPNNPPSTDSDSNTNSTLSAATEEEPAEQKPTLENKSSDNDAVPPPTATQKANIQPSSENQSPETNMVSDEIATTTEITTEKAPEPAVAPAILPIPNQQNLFKGLGVGFNAGFLLGAGFELTYPLHPKLTLRTGIQFLGFEDDFDEDGIEYDVELNFNTSQIIMDWHPFEGAFHLSAGLYRSSSDLTFSSTTAGEYQIGDTTYEGDLTVSGNISFPSVAPYFGFGWGHRHASGFSIFSNIGVLLIGEPTFDLTAQGTANEQGSSTSFDVSTNETFQDDLNSEKDNLEEELELEDWDVLPVINIGISYTF